MTNATASFSLPDKEKYFRELKKTPTISWPAMALFVVALFIIAAASSKAITGAIPLWVGMVANGFALYLLFSIMHEALHRNLSTNSFVNETLGRISLVMLIPAAPLEIARWAHFKHHRFTSSEQDPDNFIHDAKWWQMPIRWANFDLNYLYLFLTQEGDHRQRYGKALLIQASLIFAAVAALTAFGYGMEVLFLWFLASRIALFFLAIVFVYLPHHPAEVTAQENEYQATSIRLGWEWLLTPLFVYQNYHLMHHLYPTMPFYNYIKIWHLKYDELIAENPPIQQKLGLMPVNAQRKRKVR